MSCASLTVEDRLLILDLYARQSHAIDSGDAAGWAATFTTDGTFESPTFQLLATGPAELEEFAHTSNTTALERGEQLRHWVSAISLGPTGEAAVSARANLLIVATSKSGSRIDRSLRIEDTLRRGGDGAWLFSSRSVYRDDAAFLS